MIHSTISNFKCSFIQDRTNAVVVVLVIINQLRQVLSIVLERNHCCNQLTATKHLIFPYNQHKVIIFCTLVYAQTRFTTDIKMGNINIDIPQLIYYFVENNLYHAPSILLNRKVVKGSKGLRILFMEESNENIYIKRNGWYLFEVFSDVFDLVQSMKSKSVEKYDTMMFDFNLIVIKDLSNEILLLV